MSPDVGQLYLLRHYTFEKHAIVMASNAHLSLQDVTIFSFPGNGFQTGGDQHHVELLRCRITYPPNEDRSITLTGGGFMLDQSRGGFIKLEDCDFGYLGDDCVDIHDDNTHSGVRRVDDYTLVATHLVPWTCPFSPGDPVEIRNRDFSPAGFTGTVKEVKADYKKSETTLVFQQKLPGHVPSDANLFNHRYGTPDCIIRNCYFHENRARGILFCASGGCLIEGNRFFHNEHAALFLFADTSWGEGFGARNVIVRNNRFESSNSMGAEDGAAVYVEVDINGTPSHYPLLENLLLENNLFQEMTGPAVVATSFRNLIIRSNTIINRETGPIALKMRGAIRAELGNGLYVEQNEWTTQDHFASPSLFYDPDTTSGVVCHGNQLK